MSNRSEKGVTLVELLLVVVIAGLIASVAVPSLIKGRQAANSAVAVGLIPPNTPIVFMHHSLH